MSKDKCKTCGGSEKLIRQVVLSPNGDLSQGVEVPCPDCQKPSDEKICSAEDFVKGIKGTLAFQEGNEMYHRDIMLQALRHIDRQAEEIDRMRFEYTTLELKLVRKDKEIATLKAKNERLKKAMKSILPIPPDTGESESQWIYHIIIEALKGGE